MRKLKDFFHGARYALNGIRLFYQTPQLWKYSLFPLLLVLIIYVLWAILGYCCVKNLSAFFAEKCADLPGFLQWLSTVASALSIVGITLIFVVIAAVCTGTLYELSGGLFFDALVEQFSGKICPEKLTKSDWKFNLKAVWSGIVYSLVTVLWIVAALLLDLLLPMIGQIIGAFIISYRFGVAYLALSGFHFHRSMQQTKAFAHANIMLTAGYGLIIYLIYLFPLAIIFALPGLIVGSVLLLNDKLTCDC